MSRFSRAFDGALKAAKLQQADAAKIAGYHTSMVSRVLKGSSALKPKHVERLLLAINNASDREHCLREFLFDCCPEDYREGLIVNYGAARESAAKGMDGITSDISTLERLAVDNSDLEELIRRLIKILTRNAGSKLSSSEPRAISRVLKRAERESAATPPSKKRSAG